jgi:hypothetical protein
MAIVARWSSSPGRSTSIVNSASRCEGEKHISMGHAYLPIPTLCHRGFHSSVRYDARNNRRAFDRMGGHDTVFHIAAPPSPLGKGWPEDDPEHPFLEREKHKPFCIQLRTTNSTNRLTECAALCAVFESRAHARLLLLLFLLSACGRSDVVLVTDKPLAPGTVFQDELLLQGGDGVASKYLVQAEVRSDGSVGLVYHRDPNGASDGPLSLDGIPLVWRGTPEGWNVTLENGSPIGAQASDLKTIVPPFLANSIYPARPMHVGERWGLAANEIRALISQVSGSTFWSKALNDDGALSGWMELASLADRDGQQCALLHFEVTIRTKWIDTTRILQVRGDAVRSLSSFQDLSMEESRVD